MSQNDAPQQQGILGVRSFAVQLDSDSDAGSVRSNGIDSPPLDRKPEEKDSARRATLAALGLVPGPPPPVQLSQQQASSPVLTPRGGPALHQGTAHNSSRDLAAPSACAVPKAADLRRPTSPVRPLRGIGFGPENWQPAALFRPSSPSAGRPVYNNFDSKNAGSEGLPTDERMTSSVTSQLQGTNHTGAFSSQRAPMNALQEVEAAEAAAPLLSSAGVDRTSSGGATASTSAIASNFPVAGGDADSMPVQPPVSIVPSSPFQAVQVFDTSEPFVAPVVPPIRTKGPAPSSIGGTAPVRTSSRFQERFTSPTTTRIVDELLDEVVAHRLTPRDSTSSGRQNEHPARPRGRGANDDTVDLPRVKHAQDIQRGAGHGSSFRDLETAVPTAVAASAQSAFAPPAAESEPSSRATSQALSEERSSSIGEELKMVMKSERGGRLARDSAELLAGDKPGEFTVLTEEGSSIPVAVKDLSPAATAASLAGMAAGDNPPVSEVTPTRNWWGSMTAALGLKGGAEGSPAAGPDEGGAGGSATEKQPPTEQSEVPLAVEQQPLAVSAFARDVAVKPVSAETADSSALADPSGGSAAAAGSVLVSPPVKDIPAEDAEPQSTGSGFEEALSLETLKQKPAGQATEAAADALEPTGSIEAKRAASTRRSSFQMDTADSFGEDTLGTVEDPSHRVSVDMTGAPQGSALAALIASSSAASAFAAAAAAPAHPPVMAERTGSEAAFMEAMPLELPSKKKKAPQTPPPVPDSQPSRPAVTAERTRSEVAFDEALPLERPRSRSKKPALAAAPAPADVSSSRASPWQDSPGATWDNAVPLELTRKRGGAGSAAPVAAQPAAAPEKAGGWEEAAPLEGSSRKSTKSMPTSPTRAQVTPSQTLEASPRPKAKLGRSSSSSRPSPPPVAPGDFSDEAEFAHDPDLARHDSLDQRLPLMHNLHGRYSLESSGTERYDLYIDRAAAYAKAQEGARKAALLAGNVSPTRQSSLGSLDSATAVTFATARRVPHMGGIAAGTHAPQLRGINEAAGMEPEPDIDMPEPGTPTSESESEEADGDALFFPSQGKGGEGGMGAGNKMHGLVGVSHASPPPSAFASAQPPRSVFADAQAPTSDSEAEADNASSPAPTAYVPVVSAQDVGRRNSQLEGKVKPGNGRTDLEAEQQMPETPPQKLPQARKPAFFCCFSRPATR